MHPEDSGGTTGYAALKQLILTADTRMYKNKAAAKSQTELQALASA